jgi:hypothetical protein
VKTILFFAVMAWFSLKNLGFGLMGRLDEA